MQHALEDTHFANLLTYFENGAMIGSPQNRSPSIDEGSIQFLPERWQNIVEIAIAITFIDIRL